MGFLRPGTAAVFAGSDAGHALELPHKMRFASVSAGFGHGRYRRFAVGQQIFGTVKAATDDVLANGDAKLCFVESLQIRTAQTNLGGQGVHRCTGGRLAEQVCAQAEKLMIVTAAGWFCAAGGEIRLRS